MRLLIGSSFSPAVRAGDEDNEGLSRPSYPDSDKDGAESGREAAK